MQAILIQSQAKTTIAKCILAYIVHPLKKRILRIIKDPSSKRITCAQKYRYIFKPPVCNKIKNHLRNTKDLKNGNFPKNQKQKSLKKISLSSPFTKNVSVKSIVMGVIKKCISL
jgi:hypothetical protein